MEETLSGISMQAKLMNWLRLHFGAEFFRSFSVIAIWTKIKLNSLERNNLFWKQHYLNAVLAANLAGFQLLVLLLRF